MFQSRFISIKNRNLCNKKWGVESLRPDRWFGRIIVFVHTDKIQNTSVKSFIGGIIIIILILLIGNRMYLGLSLELLAKSFESSVIPYAFIIKLLLTSITLATGFQGGEVTP